jgi:hypothetical protein
VTTYTNNHIWIINITDEKLFKWRVGIVRLLEITSCYFISVKDIDMLQIIWFVGIHFIKDLDYLHTLCIYIYMEEL